MEKNNHLSPQTLSGPLTYTQASQAALVSGSFAVLEPNTGPLIDLFFARLFQIEPDLRCMFPNDLNRTKTALIRTLTHLVHAHELAHEWHTELVRLGARHKQYGVAKTEYQIFGQALFWTLEKGLGQDWTEPTRCAWHNWYAQLVSAMSNAADPDSLSTSL